MALTVERPPGPGTSSTPSSRAPAALAAAAGPLLVVAAVLVALRHFVFAGRVSVQHVDVLAFWLPTHCFLGTSLAAGHIPVWNPHALAGTPFAADPQSGWMYLPAMVLYAALPCGTALGLFVAFHPALAGLGTYWFLRGEDASRPAATLGALALALGMAGSRLALTFPFAGALAWTTVMLAGASRLVRADRPWASLGWLALLAGAWGQVAAAHLSHGLIVGTGALAAYLAVRLGGDVRRGRRRPGQALALAGLVVAALLLVNLAYLLPRLAYVPRTTLRLGWRGMDLLAADLAGRAPPPLEPGASQAALGWPLAFATAPGAYLGAATLALALGGLRSARHRSLAAALLAYGAACYVVSLRPVAALVAAHLPLGRVTDLYLHEPNRFRYGVFLVLPLLGALGLDAWREARSGRERLLVLAPGLAVWAVLPLAAGVAAARLALPAAGALAGGAALGAVARRPRLAAAVPALLAVELSASAAVGLAADSEYLRTGTDPPVLSAPFTPLLEPRLVTRDYLRPGPVADAIRKGGPARFAGVSPALLGERGYLESQDPDAWGLLVNQRGLLLGLEDAQGYNPTQLLTYWTFLRTAGTEGVKYNAAVFVDPSPEALDLLDVRWVVGSVEEPPLPGTELVVRDGRWAPYRRPTASTRASVVTAWRVVPERDALHLATGPGPDPAMEVLLLDEGPGPAAPAGGPSGGSARYRPLGPHAAEVRVDARAPALVLVRNVWDPGWTATVDGDPVPVLRANYLVQAVPVPAGAHTVELRYRDPWVGYGLLGSALSLAALAGAAAVLRRRSAG